MLKINFKKLTKAVQLPETQPSTPTPPGNTLKTWTLKHTWEHYETEFFHDFILLSGGGGDSGASAGVLAAAIIVPTVILILIIVVIVVVVKRRKSQHKWVELQPKSTSTD